MDILLQNGDHGLDDRGLPATVEGARELAQRALIRLGVKKGSFAPDPELGSELHRLRRVPPTAMDRAALSYVQEALAAVPELSVEGVRCTCRETGGLELWVGLTWRTETMELFLEVEE